MGKKAKYFSENPINILSVKYHNLQQQFQTCTLNQIQQICEKMFYFPGNLSLDSLPEDRLRNLVVCDPGDKNKFHCGLCNKPFSRKSSTFDHIMYVHTQKRDYKCFHCDKMLATSSLRSMHIHNKHLTEHKARKLLQLQFS